MSMLREETCIDDAYHLTKPHRNGEGLHRAIIGALRQAKVKPSDINMVNAHAASTPQGDETEIRVLEKVFGEPKLDDPNYLYSNEHFQRTTPYELDAARLKKVYVTSNKGNIGHTLGAAGAIESAFSVLSIENGVIPSVANLQNPIKTDLCLVKGKPVYKEVNTVLKESIAFGGTNACIIFRKI